MSLPSSLGKYFKNWFASSKKLPKQKGKPHRRARLGIEAMEDRITPAVQLDPTFGVGGKVFTDFEASPASTSEGVAVAIQPDGKILAASAAGYLIRLNTDGTLDLTFGNVGKAQFVGTPSAMAIDAAGHIVVAGYTVDDAGFDFAVARYNANGLLDANFDGDGFASVNFRARDFASSVAIDGAGRVIVAGYSSDAETSGNDIAVARFNQDGSLDSTFDGDGKVITAFGTLDDRANSVVVDAWNRIIVAGFTQVTGGSGSQFALVRYNVDGSLDTTFDGDGKVATPIQSSARANDLTIDRSGRIVVAGEAFGTFALARYDSSGALDPTFDGDGTLLIGNASSFNSVAIDDFDRIVAAGYANGQNQDFAVARLNADGTLDSSFDGDGRVLTSIGSSAEDAKSIAIDSLGRIVAMGYFLDGGRNFAAVRYNTDGSLDANFDGDGKRTLTLRASQDFATSMAIDSNGNVLVVGNAASDVALARYHADGSLDPTFGINGKVLTDFAFGGSARGLAIDGMGRFVVAGVANTGNTWDIWVARYNPNGSLDETFDGDGSRIFSLPSTNEDVGGVTVDSSGRIVLAGSSSTQILIIRCNPDGSLDSAFDGDGLATTSFGPGTAWAGSLIIDEMGRIVVSGSTGVGAGVVRFNADGSLDTTFDGDGRAAAGFGSGFENATGLAIDSLGRIVMVGFSDANGGQLDFAIARFNPDGSLDTTFDSDGRVLTPVGPGSDIPGPVVIDSAGRIIVAGHVVNGTNRDIALVRYLNNGSLDTSFDGDGKLITAMGLAEDIVAGMKFDSSGRIVVAGYSVGVREDFSLARFVLSSDPPLISLANDTGRPNDKLTSNGTLSLSGVDQGFTVEYSIDGGSTWASTFTAAEGINHVRVRQADASGNVSAASNPFVFTLDTSAPLIDSLASATPNPRNVPLTSIDVLFSEPIDLATFNYADLVLQRDGSSNLINAASGVSIVTTADPKLYRIQFPTALTAASGSYVLRVTAAGIADLAGNAATNNVQSAWVMNANGIMGVPAITSPTGAVNDATPTITWNAITYAAKYDLWVDNLTTGASQVIRQQNLTGTSFTPSANLSFGEYRMWIRAVNGAGTPGAWGAGVNFRIAAPTVTAPIGTASSDTPTIAWSAVDGASRYDLWVDNVSAGISQVIRRASVTTTSAIPASPLAPGMYRAWVRAFDAVGYSTGWSAASDFTVGIPTVTGPIGTAPSSTPTIAWTALSNVTRYDLWVDNLTTGASPVIRQMSLATNSFDVTTPLSSGQYRVWVRAFNTNGAASPWSKSLDFVVGIPTVTAPIGGGQTTTPTFSWMAVPNAVRYDLWVDNRTTGQSQAIRQTSLTATTYTPTSPLTAGQSYRVWVRSFDAQNLASLWSVFADFAISNVI